MYTQYGGNKTESVQEAQLSQTNHAMLHVTEYFAESLKVTEWYNSKAWLRV